MTNAPLGYDHVAEELYCLVCEEPCGVTLPTGVTACCHGCAATWWEHIYPELLEEVIGSAAQEDTHA